MLELRNFIPEKLHWRDAAPRMRWSYLGPNRLTHPLYEQTLLHSRCQRGYRQLETSVEELVEHAAENPGVSVHGLIFHVSRCGSTLLARMLAASAGNIVASEAPPLDDILRSTHISCGIRIQWLRATVSAIALPRTGTERACYLKLEPWHLTHFDLLREAFPEAPWVFLYREPVEVLVSHQRIPGSWLVPSLLTPETFGLTLEHWQPPRLEIYWAQVIARLCRVALAHAEEPVGLLLNYCELPGAFTTKLASHFGIPADQLPIMQAAADRDAKAPQNSYRPDSAAKRTAASDCIRAAAAQHLMSLYEELEAARLKG